MSDKNFKEIIVPVVQGNGKIFPLFLCTALSASDMLDTAPLLRNQDLPAWHYSPPQNCTMDFTWWCEIAFISKLNCLLYYHHNTYPTTWAETASK